MRRRFVPIALALLAAPISLAACGSNDVHGASSGAGGAATGASASTAGLGGAGPSSGPTTSSGAGAGGADPGVPYVYVGSDDGSIYVLSLDRQSGSLTPLGSVAAGNYPSFLAVTPSKTFLYAVNEASAEVASFSIDPGTGSLTPINAVGSQGGGPAYVSVDRGGTWALVANYGGGTVAVLPIGSDGSLGAAVSVAMPGVNPHLFRTDPSNQFAFVPCKGSDWVAQFSFDAATGAIAPLDPPVTTTTAGAGPRHLDFHPTLDIAYVIDENDSTVTAYARSGGSLAPLQTVSTLPDGFVGTNTGADVHVSRDGRFLYGSNRGHDSIVIYEIDAAGHLTLVGHESSGGSTPRNFGLDPAGDVLLVANQNSSNVVSFHVDTTTGLLTPLATAAVSGKPNWVGVIPQPSP